MRHQYITGARAHEIFRPLLNARAALFLHTGEAPPPPALSPTALVPSSSSTPAAVLHSAPGGPQRGSRPTPCPTPRSSTPHCSMPPCRHQRHRVVPSATVRRPTPASSSTPPDTIRATPAPSSSSTPPNHRHRPHPCLVVHASRYLVHAFIYQSQP